MTDAGALNCNLTSDRVTGVFRGVANTQTTIQIKDSTGQALFQSISYGDNVIGTNTASATFRIASGNSPLTFAYAAPIPGDDIALSDPCGNELDKFKNDPGNPFGRHLVVA